MAFGSESYWYNFLPTLNHRQLRFVCQDGDLLTFRLLMANDAMMKMDPETGISIPFSVRKADLEQSLAASKVEAV